MFFPRSRSAGPSGSGPGGVACRRPGDDRRPQRPPLGPSRGLEADHDFSLAAGRSHQSHADGRARRRRSDYRPGKFLPAYNEGSNDNEFNEVWIDYNGHTVVFRQVVGLLARRIVCRVQEGQMLERGQRVGLMKFGSRMDVFLPRDATVLVSVGDRVVGGETVLATLRSAGAR